ncbi:MAG TPA: four helix bundle protein [Bacteroidales bacterium]|nr:four helix bundle protein [Bacteroidales bacterium]
MEEEKNFNFFRFEDLRIYHKALDYAIWVKNVTKDFPEHEIRGLAYHFSRAAQFIAINIAEGSGRNKGQFIYCLKMGKSSIRECVVLTTLAKKFGYIDESAEEYSRNELIEMTKMIGALISSLQKSTRSNSGSHDNVNDDDDDDFDNTVN